MGSLARSLDRGPNMRSKFDHVDTYFFPAEVSSRSLSLYNCVFPVAEESSNRHLG